MSERCEQEGRRLRRAAADKDCTASSPASILLPALPDADAVDASSALAGSNLTGGALPATRCRCSTTCRSRRCRRIVAAGASPLLIPIRRGLKLHATLGLTLIQLFGEGAPIRRGLKLPRPFIAAGTDGGRCPDQKRFESPSGGTILMQSEAIEAGAPTRRGLKRMWCGQLSAHALDFIHAAAI